MGELGDESGLDVLRAARGVACCLDLLRLRLKRLLRRLPERFMGADSVVDKLVCDLDCVRPECA